MPSASPPFSSTTITVICIPNNYSSSGSKKLNSGEQHYCYLHSTMLAPLHISPTTAIISAIRTKPSLYLYFDPLERSFIYWFSYFIYVIVGSLMLWFRTPDLKMLGLVVSYFILSNVEMYNLLILFFLYLRSDIIMLVNMNIAHWPPADYPRSWKAFILDFEFFISDLWYEYDIFCFFFRISDLQICDLRDFDFVFRVLNFYFMIFVFQILKCKANA